MFHLDKVKISAVSMWKPNDLSLTTSPLTNIAGEVGDTTALTSRNCVSVPVPCSSLEASVEAVQAEVVSKE